MSLLKNLNDELSKKILSYNNEYGRKPHLLVILVGDNPASQVYVKNKEKKAAEVGIKSTVIRLSKNTSENNLAPISIKKIIELILIVSIIDFFNTLIEKSFYIKIKRGCIIQ